jgi:hypothetical protein
MPRGLAPAAKIATLRWAAANGIPRDCTANDDTNAPMLASNRRLAHRSGDRLLTFRHTIRAER